MSIAKQNQVRNVASDQSRIEMWSNKPTLLKTFTSKEYATFWGFLRPRWKGIVFLTLFAVFVAFIEGARTVAMIGLIKGLVSTGDEAMAIFQAGVLDNLGLTLPESRLGFIGVLFAVLLALTILMVLSQLLATIISRKLQLGLMRDIRKVAIDKIFSFDLNYFSQAKSGELIFLMTSETSRFSNIVTFAGQFLTFGSQCFIYLGILLYMEWDLTLIVILFGVLFFLFHLTLDIRLKVKGAESNMSQNNLSHLFHQIIYGIKMIKIGALEDREKGHYLAEHSQLEEKEIKLALVQALSRMAQEMTMVIALLLVISYIYYFKDLESLLKNPADLLAYLFLLIRAIPAGIQLQGVRSKVLSAYGPLSRVMSVIQSSDPASARRALRGKAKPDTSARAERLSVNDVSFSYGNRGEGALHSVNAIFEQGQLTALVGFSGSGKSTLLDILSSVREPTAGHVALGESPLDELDDMVYKRMIGYMNQEPIIFHDSVRMNVSYFRPEATDEQIWAALKMAAADDFVDSLPSGLDTGMGERGQTISGGERQRIGLARVFLQDAPILLLDEATNALDYETEKKIYDNLRSVSHNKIIVVAAHRLSAIKDYPQIIMMQIGEMIERGIHSELMALGGSYHDLYMVQEKERG